MKVLSLVFLQGLGPSFPGCLRLDRLRLKHLCPLVPSGPLGWRLVGNIVCCRVVLVGTICYVVPTDVSCRLHVADMLPKSVSFDTRILMSCCFQHARHALYMRTRTKPGVGTYSMSSNRFKELNNHKCTTQLSDFCLLRPWWCL